MEKKYTVKYEEKANFINFTQDNTNLAIGLMFDNYTRYDKPEFFELTLSHVKIFKNNGSKVKTSINLIPCTREFFNEEVVSDFEFLNLGKFQCAEDRSLLVAEGGEFENLWQYTEWTIKIKKNVDYQLVETWLNTHPTKVAMYYPDLTIDQKNMTKPVTKLIRSQFFYLSNQMYKKEFFEFGNVRFDANDNRALDDYTRTKYLMLESKNNDGYFIRDRKINELLGNGHYRNIIRIYINSSNVSHTFQRRVNKIQEYLTTIQFFSVLLIMGQVLASIVNQYYLRKDIMKSVIKMRDCGFYNDLIDRITYYYTPNIEADTETKSSKLRPSLNPVIKHQKKEKNL